MATKRMLKTADKNVNEMDQVELAHEQKRIEEGQVTLNNEVGNLNRTIHQLNVQLLGLATSPALNSVQRLVRRYELNRQLTETTFERDVRNNALARYAGRSAEITSRMQPYGYGVLNRLRADIRVGKPTAVDLNAPLINEEDQRGLKKSSSKIMMDYFKNGVTFFRDQRPIQKFMRGAFRSGGGFNLIGGIGALKGVPVLGLVATAVNGAYQAFKQLDAFASYQKRLFSEEQADYNATLLSGLDFNTATGLGRAIAIRGGSAGDGKQLAGGIARQLGGTRYGQLPSQLMDAAMKFGLKIHGSGYGGMATTEEILTDIANKMKDANAIDKEQLAYMASQLGLSAATVRAMEDGGTGFNKIIHVFDGLEDQFGENAMIKAADNAKFADELRRLSGKNLQMSLFGGSFSAFWDTKIAGIMNFLNLAFGDKVEENKQKEQQNHRVKMMIGDYNKTALEGGFKADPARERAYRKLIIEEAEKSGLGESNARAMLQGTDWLNQREKEVFNGDLVARISVAKQKLKEMDDAFAKNPHITDWHGADFNEWYQRYSLLAGMQAEYKKNEDGSYQLTNISTGNEGSKVVINGNVVVDTNPKNAEELTEDLANRREENIGVARKFDESQQ